MCFGMGLSCLQCTFSTKDLDHARYVHDQLNVLSPLFLALTAGTPFIKGKVSDWDVRWNIISGSVDDRPEEEKDPSNPRYIPDSRYSSTNLYIWDGPFNLPQYNDFDLKITEEEKQKILTAAKKLNI
jgi:glutamate--cysteine ligase catalytic subunit